MSDLISREALKEAFKAWKTMDDYYHNTDCNDIPFSEAFDLIDNAQTVKTYCYFCGQTEHGRFEERPQGKWIFHEDFNESCRYGCNQCGNLTNIPSNFCPNCGVRMQKGD